jgi:RHS repeat-associated protein
VVETQLQDGYTSALSEGCYTSPLLLLGVCLHPRKSADPAEKQPRNSNVTVLNVVSESALKGWMLRGWNGARGQRETVVSPQGKTTTYRYNAVGNRDSVISPNSVTSGYQYDELNRLTRVRHYKAGSVLAHYAYALNAAGIRTQVTDKDSSKVIYGYDSLYRLKSERRTGNHTDTMTYTYDQVGNRLTKLRRGVTTTYAYNNRDQMLSEWDGTDSTRYSYDSAGRTLTKVEVGGTTHYRWRDEDRLDSLYGPGVSVKYQYDADGKRVKDSTGSTVRQYLIDPLLPYGQVIAETDGSNSLVAEYTYGADRVSLRRSGAAHYYLADGQGSTRLLTDSTGTATDSTVYTAFGETLFSSGSTPNDFRYIGEQLDGNSGFYYNRARWLDTKVGRFLGVDPFEGYPQSPLSLHRYLYANSSPPSYSDPSGKISLLDVAITIAFVSFSVQVGLHNAGVFFQRPPDDDGYITLPEANWQWKYGGGKPLHARLDKLHLGLIKTSDFNKETGKYLANFLNPFDGFNFNEGAVFGRIWLRLLEGTDVVADPCV